ncbi:unnamed protein product [Brassica rapa]|uniref:DUF659 domain-containing protein n=1 Tax=Brassica campestris TaxID=3711 RepID=A0A3P5Z125_BRACM|nr:unnamed protein product [Brassica rapa]VDC66771.1 unnamed protein product [Brassica rapa]
MSDAGAGTSRGGSQGGGSQGGQQADPGRKYGIMVKNNINHWKCIFCNKVLTAGVSQLKQHFVGGHKNAKKYPVCPEHVRAELGNYMAVRAAERAAQSMRYEAAVNEDDVEEVDGDQPVRKAAKRKNRGPLDKFVMSLPPDILKGRKDRKAVFGACDKDLRDKVCGGIARWFYDAGIAFNAASHDSLKEMTKLIGQYGMGLKPPSMYELRFPLLQNEVANVDAELVPNREEWAVKGCSIMSDGWRDSVVQKDIVNFLVNSPKGSVFIRSKEVFEVVKDATLLFKLLDDMVEEVGEKNVVQVVTDNASNYVKAGRLLEAKRPHLFWTPCAAHCLDLMLEDIGKIEAVKSAMKKCMFINAYIYCRVPLVNMMKRFTDQRNLHRPAVRRFTTSFITLSQYHLQQANLKKMVTSEEWDDSKWPKEAGARKLKQYILQDSFWRNIAYALKISSPLVKVLRIVDGERKPPMGYI